MFEFFAQHPVFTAILTLMLLGVAFGAILGFASVKFKVEGDPVIDQLDELLPQTQCGQCGYPGCHPYAEAIAEGDAINKCVPGGQTTINQIANLLHVDAPTLDEEHGEEQELKHHAFIREDECIGCTKCIQACPVDAILGSQKHMHTVIVSECTGCDLCVEPCPVDCIEMKPIEITWSSWSWDLPKPVAEQLQVIASDRPAATDDSSDDIAA